MSHSTAALQGQKALVTGGDSGIGAAVALALAAAGAAVGVNYRSDARSADVVVRTIRERDGEALPLHADVSKAKDVAAMFLRFVKEYGRIDILVANAGIQKDAPVTGMTLEIGRRCSA